MPRAAGKAPASQNTSGSMAAPGRATPDLPAAKDCPPPRQPLRLMHFVHRGRGDTAAGGSVGQLGAAGLGAAGLGAAGLGAAGLAVPAACESQG
jgi:hypothetical protein